MHPVRVRAVRCVRIVVLRLYSEQHGDEIEPGPHRRSKREGVLLSFFFFFSDCM